MRKNVILIFLKKKIFIAYKIEKLIHNKFLIKTFIILFLSLLFYSLVNKINQIEIFNINQFFNTKIRTNSILIFESNNFHYECTPGFVKYFLDLGFNVDIIMTIGGNGSFIFFEPKKILRFFILDNSKYYRNNEYIEKFREIFNKYFAILVQTKTVHLNYFYKNSNLLKGKNSIFVYHHYPGDPPNNFHNNIRSWTLLNFTNFALEVNPHYFGKIKFMDKNKITRFFIVSSFNKNYDQLIYASDKLEKENFQFQIIVTGRSHDLNNNRISKNVKNKYLFKYYLSYFNLMKVLATIDFIIIPLNLNNTGDNAYNIGKTTGSAQLSYGFLKPCLINNDFTKTYGMNKENSIIFNNLKDSLYFAMRNAIMMTNEEYKKKQYNLKKTADKIYKISKNNVKTTINYIFKS